MFGHHRVKVATEALDSTGGRMLQGAQSIGAELHALLSRVTGLTEQEWEGMASGAFRDLYAQFNDGCKQVETALEGMATKLRGTAAVYDETEVRIASGYRPM